MKDFMDFSGALDGEDLTISQGADSFTTGTDYNGDGIMDGEAIYEDLNGDGVFDTITASVDTNGDGSWILFLYIKIQTAMNLRIILPPLWTLIQTGMESRTVCFFGEDANGDAVFETTQIMDAEEWAMFIGSRTVDMSR